MLAHGRYLLLASFHSSCLFLPKSLWKATLISVNPRVCLSPVLSTKCVWRLLVAPRRLCVCLRELTTESHTDQRMEQTQGLVSQGLTINGWQVAKYFMPLGSGCLEGLLPSFSPAAPSGSPRVQPPISAFGGRSRGHRFYTSFPLPEK